MSDDDDGDDDIVSEDDGFQFPIESRFFYTKEEAIEFVKVAAKSFGKIFGVTKRSSNKTTTYLACDRFRPMKTTSDTHFEEEEEENTTGKKRRMKKWRGCGCQWSACVMEVDYGKWQVYTNNPNHNHSPSGTAGIHPCHCREALKSAEKQLINLHSAGISRKQILSVLRSDAVDKGNDSLCIQPVNITNALRAHRAASKLPLPEPPRKRPQKRKPQRNDTSPSNILSNISSNISSNRSKSSRLLSSIEAEEPDFGKAMAVEVLSQINNS
jgi:hypothetical protein